MSTTLYRFYDAGDELLYVGITSAGPYRWIEHERNREWWHLVVRSTTEHYPTREAAAAAEKAAIEHDRPIYNVRHAAERSVKPARTYRPRGTGTVIYRAERDRWAVIPPPPMRGWFYFRTEAQARAFLDVTLALVDEDVRSAARRLLEQK